jgi:hypothetical protein
MPLPEKVIEQLGREPSSGTRGWAVGALLFSGGLLFLALVLYFGLTYGYQPYLQSQLTAAQTQVTGLNNSISSDQQVQLIDFYSQIANLQTLLQNHVLASQFFSWLEKNTEANVYYQTFSLTSAHEVSLTGVANTEADVNQQLAIFENAPGVVSASVSDVTAPQSLQGGWDFTVTLAMSPSIFLASNQ